MSIKRARKQRKRAKKLRNRAKKERNKNSSGISPGTCRIRKLSEEEARRAGWGTPEEVAQGKAKYVLAKVIKE